MSENCTHAYRAFNQDGDVIEMACDQWACNACSHALAWRWAERVRFGIALWPMRDCYFWTLTLPPWVQYPKTGFRILPDIWDKFRREMQRYDPAWQYAAFVECHPQRSLIPHFHIISLTVAPRRLKDIAVRSGFGYQAWDVPITSKGAASYVTKYASKQGYEMPKGFRRVRISHLWPKLPKPAYDLQIYPMKSRESVRAYVRRVSALVGLPFDTMLGKWLAKNDDTAI